MVNVSDGVIVLMIALVQKKILSYKNSLTFTVSSFSVNYVNNQQIMNFIYNAKFLCSKIHTKNVFSPLSVVHPGGL